MDYAERRRGDFYPRQFRPNRVSANGRVVTFVAAVVLSQASPLQPARLRLPPGVAQDLALAATEPRPRHRGDLPRAGTGTRPLPQPGAAEPVHVRR